MYACSAPFLLRCLCITALRTSPPLLPSPLLAADAGTAEGRGPSTWPSGTAHLCGKRKRRKEETSLNGERIWIDTTTALLWRTGPPVRRRSSICPKSVMICYHCCTIIYAITVLIYYHCAIPMLYYCYDIIFLFLIMILLLVLLILLVLLLILLLLLDGYSTFTGQADLDVTVESW